MLWLPYLLFPRWIWLLHLDTASVFPHWPVAVSCAVNVRLPIATAEQYLPEQPQDVWTGRLPTDLGVWQRQDRPRCGLAQSPRGFLSFSKVGTSYKYPLRSHVMGPEWGGQGPQYVGKVLEKCFTSQPSVLPVATPPVQEQAGVGSKGPAGDAVRTCLFWWAFSYWTCLTNPSRVWYLTIASGQQCRP